jgi:hypothetical protein
VDDVGGLTIETRDWTGPGDALCLQVTSLQLDNSSSTFNTTRYPKNHEDTLKLLDDI